MQAGGGFASSSSRAPSLPACRRPAPFLATWERLQRQVLGIWRARLTHGDPQGAELRQAIADYVNLERGARATADRVLVLTSSQQALGLCASVLLDAGERIFVEDPAYYGARKAFEAAGLECLPVPVDEQGLRPEPILAQPQAARALCLTPSHHYPTGVTLSLERRLALIEWAQRQQAWIIEDDYDSEFHYAGRPTACVQGLDVHERTLYIGTFTKSLFPGLRIGYMVLPPALVAPMTVARSLQDGHNASLAQLTLARFIAGGHFGAYVRGMRNLYGERLGFLAERVGKRLGGLVEPRVPAGGLQMPGLLCAEIDETRAIAAAYRAGVELVGLSALHLAAPPRAGFLMGFAAYTTDELEAAVGVLAKTLRGLRANPQVAGKRSVAQGVDVGIDLGAVGQRYPGRHAPVFGAFEFIQRGPVLGEAVGDEHMAVDFLAVGVDRQARKAHPGAPALSSRRPRRLAACHCPPIFCIRCSLGRPGPRLP